MTSPSRPHTAYSWPNNFDCNVHVVTVIELHSPQRAVNLTVTDVECKNTKKMFQLQMYTIDDPLKYMHLSLTFIKFSS